MIDPPDTFQRVCDTPIPIRYKYLINTYLLTLIPGKDWIIRVGAYCIRLTNSNDHRQMIDSPDTCRDVCNTNLPIRDKYLINMYLLNLILGKNWIIRVEVYCIRHTNTHDCGQMIDPPDTFQGVCNTPLPIRIKNLILIYWVRLKLGWFLDVCLCDQPHPDELLLKIVWMYAKPSEDWTNMVIFTENSARIGWVLLMPCKPRRVTLKICMRACKTRRGLDEYGYFHREPAEDWMDMTNTVHTPTSYS